MPYRATVPLRPVLVALAVLPLLSAPVAADAAPHPPSPRILYDYATVVAVRSLEANAEAGEAGRCESARGDATGESGDAPAGRPRAAPTSARPPGAPAGDVPLAMGTPRIADHRLSIASAMLRELDVARDGGAAPSCGAVAGPTPVAYEVTYRYDGRLYREIMAEPPDQPMRVRVELAPIASRFSER